MGETSPTKMDLSKAVFTKGERTLCYHSGLIYEAKVLDLKLVDGEFAYLVHYNGWSKKWDEFVPEKCVLKYNEANLEKQRDVKRAREEENRSGAKKSVKISLGKRGRSLPKKATDGNVSDVSNSNSRASTPIMDSKEGKDETINMPKLEIQAQGSGKDVPTSGSEVDKDENQQPFEENSSNENSNSADKLGLDQHRSLTESASNIINNTSHDVVPEKKFKKSRYAEEDDECEVKQQVNLQLPPRLKEILVDDSDMINIHRKLLKLPARHTVRQILEDFLESEGENPDTSIVELCEGIKDYFELMLGTQLLYKYERIQYDKVICKDESGKKNVLDSYGAVHLFRLFSKLGDLLSYAPMDPFAVNVLQTSLDKILKFSVDRVGDYFDVNDYDASEPEYQRKLPPTY